MLTPINLSGAFYKPTGEAAQGIISFELITPLFSADDNKIVTKYKKEATLSAGGSFLVQLFATDSPNSNPPNAYRVNEKFDGHHPNEYLIALSSSQPNQNLADLTPVAIVRPDFLYSISNYFICTSLTRPTTPIEGWMIYEKDTNQLRVFNGITWDLVTTTPG